MAGAGFPHQDPPTRRRLLSVNTEEPSPQLDATPKPDCMNVDATCWAGRLDENSLHAIFQHLIDPPDLKAAASVCRDWHRVIVEGRSWRALCNRLVAPGGVPGFSRGEVKGSTERLGKTPGGQWFLGLSAEKQEALMFQHLSGVLAEKVDADGGSAEISATAQENAARHFLESARSFLEGVRHLSNGAPLHIPSGGHSPSGGGDSLSNGRQRNLIVDAIAASTTDNYPEECISKTLKEHARERTGNVLQACYWSSKGDTYATKDESLLYQLAGPTCVVSSFYVRPFKAFFQPKQPVYSSAQVRFKLGYRVTPESEPCAMDVDTSGTASKNGEWSEEQGAVRRRDKFREADYVWTYESPRFPMAQDDTLQRFDLPAPVLCSNGVLRVDLIGKVQRQEDYDNLYYTCITHVKAVGIALPCFRCRPTPKGDRILEYCADAPRLPLSDIQPHPSGPDVALFIADIESDDEELEDEIWD